MKYILIVSILFIGVQVHSNEIGYIGYMRDINGLNQYVDIGMKGHVSYDYEMSVSTAMVRTMGETSQGYNLSINYTGGKQYSIYAGLGVFTNKFYDCEGLTKFVNDGCSVERNFGIYPEVGMLIKEFSFDVGFYSRYHLGRYSNYLSAGMYIAYPLKRLGFVN